MIFAGLVFFFNPLVALHDILPDIIGALLIFVGLRKAADADEHFEDTRRASLSVVWLYAAKLVFSFTLVTYSDNALPFTFLAGVFESIFMCSFFSRLYGAFEYTAFRGGDAKSLRMVSDAKIVSCIFIITRSVCAFAPEILELLKQNDELDLRANASYVMPIIRLKPYLLVLCITVSLIVGIIFLVKTAGFFRAVKNDVSYRTYLAEKYECAMHENKTAHGSRAASTSCVILAFSAVFVADFAVNGIDILCDIAVLFGVLCAFLALRAFDKKALPLSLILCGVGAVLFTALGAYISPAVFSLVSGERVKVSDGAMALVQSGRSVAAAVAVSIAFLVGLGTVLWAWMSRMQTVYTDAKLGNHDRKMLTVFGLFLTTALFKGIAFVTDVYLGHLATNEAVAEFIKLRPRMNADHLAKAVEENVLCARFEALDGAYLVIRLVMLVLAVFTVFNVLALKSEAEREK